MAGTTQYFGVTYPTSTDYVKDGALAIEAVADGFDAAVAIPTYNTQTGTSYTFVLLDAAKVTTSNNASAVTFTIPPQASVVWTTGATLTVANYGVGAVTIAGGAGVTVTNSSATIGQYGSASIIRTASNAWTIIPFAGGAALLSDSAISGTTGSPTTNTYTSGGINYKTYSFTGSGSITTTKTGLVDFLVIAGGGGGGSARSGGGGAGGYRTNAGNSGGNEPYAEQFLSLASGTYTITVGAGGAGGTSGANGSNSILSTVTSTGGGKGGNSTLAGNTGGSGGGGGNALGAGGAGTANQGFAGGASTGASGTGGGGGAGQVGSAGASGGGAGGNGIASTITGTSVTRAGGGGGGGGGGGAGGTGGGGTGASTAGNATNGTANTGGGGGGLYDGATSGNGGSGLVVIRVLA